MDVASLHQGARDLRVDMTRAEARSICRRMGLLTGGAVNMTGFYSAMNIDISVESLRRRRTDRAGAATKLSKADEAAFATIIRTLQREVAQSMQLLSSCEFTNALFILCSGVLLGDRRSNLLGR